MTLRTITRRFTGVLFALVIVAYFIAAGAIDASAQVEEELPTSVTFTFTGADFYIPRPADRSDQVGVERLLASVDVPAALVGATCSVVGTSTNGESVHPNNYGVLRSNGDFVRIDGTEDEANGVRLSDKSIVLGTTVRLFNVMLPDADGRVATSVNYLVRITCTDDTTTTTTTPSTTSTTPGSTSTSTTTSTTSTTTTTSVPPAPPTTAPTDSTTTTFPPSSSTSSPGGSTSTTVPPTVSTDPSTPPTLPDTGPADVAGMAMAGIALLMLGGGLVAAVREA